MESGSIIRMKNFMKKIEDNNPSAIKSGWLILVLILSLFHVSFLGPPLSLRAESLETGPASVGALPTALRIVSDGKVMFLGFGPITDNIPYMVQVTHSLNAPQWSDWTMQIDSTSPPPPPPASLVAELQALTKDGFRIVPLQATLESERYFRVVVITEKDSTLTQ